MNEGMVKRLYFDVMKGSSVSINLIVIKTDKVEEQLAFYSVLGLQFEHHRHGNGPLHYSSNGQPVLEIYPLPKGMTAADATTRLGFLVEALDGLVQVLGEKGFKIVAEPAQTEWGYVAVVQDVDGRKIELTERAA